MTLDLRAVRLQEVVGEALEECRPWLEHRRQKLLFESGQDGLWVKADPLRLGRVVVNLLGNASKFSPAGSTVRLSLDRERRDGQEGVRMAVEDEGSGIEPADLERVFERFYRSRRMGDEDGATDHAAGLGLGLAIARGVIQLHHGRISAANRPGGGARFTVWLPAHRPARGAEAAKAQLRPEPAPVSPAVPRRA
jgi:signal transduction histidine kinase